MNEFGWIVPGRIEVLGKHTDYAGGRVLVCAAEQGVTVTARAGAGHVRARSSAVPGEVVIGSGVDPALPPGHWGRYLTTAVQRLTVNFGPLRPAELTVESTLPLASGLSSSSALLVAVTLTLADLNGLPDAGSWPSAPLQLASYLACVENGRSYGPLAGDTGVGTRGGSEDHVAMLCGTAGELGCFGFDPPERLGAVRLPDDWTFVVAVSGVRAEKTGGALAAYNRAADTASALLADWNHRTARHDASLAAAVRAGLRVGPEHPHAARLEQFVAESERLVPDAVTALGRADLAGFGAIADESQLLAERALDNQVPATVDLQRSARRLGAAAASAFGAGFGGSVWALVPVADADDFAVGWLADHRRRFAAEAAHSLVTRPAAAARRIGA